MQMELGSGWLSTQVLKHAGSQTRGPLRTRSKQRCYTKALRPPPYSKSPTQWREVSGWDTLGKREVAQSCPTLCDPVDSSVHGTLQARILEWVASSFSRGSSRPRDRTQVSGTVGRGFNLWATREDTRACHISLPHQLKLMSKIPFLEVSPILNVIKKGWVAS